MPDRIAAIHVPITTVPETAALVRRAEELGVRAIWLTSGGYGPDSLTTLAVIGARTERILLGTSIAVTFSRHPLVMAQQAMAIDDVAPARFASASAEPSADGRERVRAGLRPTAPAAALCVLPAEFRERHLRDRASVDANELPQRIHVRGRSLS